MPQEKIFIIGLSQKSRDLLVKIESNLPGPVVMQGIGTSPAESAMQSLTGRRHGEPRDFVQGFRDKDDAAEGVAVLLAALENAPDSYAGLREAARESGTSDELSALAADLKRCCQRSGIELSGRGAAASR